MFYRNIFHTCCLKSIDNVIVTITIKNNESVITSLCFRGIEYRSSGMKYRHIILT